MRKPLFMLSLYLSIFFSLIFSFSLSYGAEIIGPEVKIVENEIYVTTSLSLDEKYMQELRNGMKKELIFHIDIFKVWDMWPDEFIFGRQFIINLMSDPIKSEHFATSNEGSKIIKKRFKSIESMITWALSFENFKLINTNELQPGKYYIKLTVESKIRKLPPVIGYFMIFLPENEFKIKKNSPFITIGSYK